MFFQKNHETAQEIDHRNYDPYRFSKYAHKTQLSF